MIRIDEKTCLLFEDAARKSLEQYGDDWRGLSRQQILDQKARNLELLSHYNGLRIGHILESESGVEFAEFAALCVQISVCQKMLNDEKIPTGGPRKFLPPNDLDELL
ncbi:hypothetical protein LCGC14_0792860 [marine sediment metagenome]|uniref:Uncharacterized protein n=1 Tax=marine sediment metagenome TaxID=412755 RepID=A0A0F9SBZ8_9ZZZZ